MMVERDPRWPADAPTDHLDTVEYWRGLYGDAIKVGQEMLTDAKAERDRYKAALEEIAKEPRNLRCEWMRQTAREAFGERGRT